jgi:hypothetical protein
MAASDEHPAASANKLVTAEMAGADLDWVCGFRP